MIIEEILRIECLYVGSERILRLLYLMSFTFLYCPLIKIGLLYLTRLMSLILMVGRSVRFIGREGTYGLKLLIQALVESSS